LIEQFSSHKGKSPEAAFRRTIERDLEWLRQRESPKIEPRMSDGSYHYHPTTILSKPAITPESALNFLIAGQHLAELLPPSSLNAWEEEFARAEEILNQSNQPQSRKRGLSAWRDKVRVIPVGPKRKLPDVDAAVRERVYNKLLNNESMMIEYRSVNSGETRLMEKVCPLGLIFRDQVGYLLCTIDGDCQPVTLALHRISSIEECNGTVPAIPPRGFDIDKEIAKGALAFADGNNITLEAVFSKELATYLQERPLSETQTMETLSDGSLRLTATVLNSRALKWWLLGFGDQVEVIGPEPLRAWFAEVANNLAARYR